MSECLFDLVVGTPIGLHVARTPLSCSCSVWYMTYNTDMCSARAYVLCTVHWNFSLFTFCWFAATHSHNTSWSKERRGEGGRCQLPYPIDVTAKSPSEKKTTTPLSRRHRRRNRCGHGLHVIGRMWMYSSIYNIIPNRLLSASSRI